MQSEYETSSLVPAKNSLITLQIQSNINDKMHALTPVCCEYACVYRYATLILHPRTFYLRNSLIQEGKLHLKSTAKP